MRTLIINRKKWLRGGSTNSQLYDALRDALGQPCKCCLGFYLEACGVPLGRLNERTTPYDLNQHSPDTIPDEAGWLLCPDRDVHSSFDANLLMSINDDRSITSIEREEKIRLWFAKHDVEVKFVDGDEGERL